MGEKHKQKWELKHLKRFLEQLRSRIKAWEGIQALQAAGESTNPAKCRGTEKGRFVPPTPTQTRCLERWEMGAP